MTPKEFLLEECGNVLNCLNQTLRFEYGSLGAREFHRECVHRLKNIRREITRSEKPSALSLWSRQLSYLSALISRIERAHVDEVSWPFAHEIIRLAEPLCAEQDVLPDATPLSPRATESKRVLPPLSPILAEGGLSSYSVHVEDSREISPPFERTIHSIVFPKSLKYHVLLHGIIAHEIGHAILSQLDIAGEIRDATEELLDSPQLKSDAALRDHLRSGKAPNEIKVQSEKSDLVEKTRISKWKTELLCDLLGLLTMGPSFLAAHSAVLTGIRPDNSWSPNHPAYPSRAALLRAVSTDLGWSTTRLLNGSLSEAENEFWEEHRRKPNAWYILHNEAALTKCVESLRSTLNQKLSVAMPKPLYLYTTPEADQFRDVVDQLARFIPPAPTAKYFKVGDKETQLEVDNKPIDFRYVLFGGWLAWYAIEHRLIEVKRKHSFENINRLCHLSILQNRSIEVFHAGAK